MSEIIIYRPTDEAYLLYLPKFAPNLVCGIRERCLDLDDEDYYKRFEFGLHRSHSK